MSSLQVSFDGESLITPELMATTVAYRDALTIEEEYATAQVHLALVLKLTQQRFEQHQDPALVIDRLIVELHKMREVLNSDVWLELVPTIQAHPVATFLHQDPFTHWSFRKPRGYSGDAHLLDFIYGHEDVAAELAAATPLGHSLHAYTKAAPAAAAVRERRDLLARFVDDAAAERDEPLEVFTIAAGHLREAELSTSLRAGLIKRWVALDQDPSSVASMEERFKDGVVQPIDGSVRGILQDAYDLGRFDAIYAAGLYDYLPKKVAVRLTQKCLQMLKPGGIFLFANFHSDIPDDAFMETFMNWALILRSDAEIQEIIEAVEHPAITETKVFAGENGNIVYGTIRIGS